MAQGLPQLACKKYFESKHPVELNEAPYHPNKYFKESRETLKIIHQPSTSKEGNFLLFVIAMYIKIAPLRD